MSSPRSIAIVGFNSLEETGLVALLREDFDGKVECHRSLDSFLPLADRHDGFIIDAAMLAEAVDFFMPRRQKLLAVTSRAASHDANHVTKSPATVSRLDDETEIRQAVCRLLDSLRDTECQQGELSLREKEVLRLLAAGKINKEIADTLCISINTVITHRKNISSKLGIKSTSGLSLYAMMNGII